mmetsp:Transcript_38458/g.61471  ORF Transcript_38458/g.61471 Transcript_38458/m.61471 type:complete len:526 (-) Transcript_38458:118-1695(-)|eukprot:CAMPEP_0197034126 /NCGR_PEP_ID=MMETSP1384-20130603/12318_1 /TAXON_ID=29189 /ORGANISM="Ammonia sp." /LENGTH=525 /DNA_ID=CAMNT_0042464011 /DNA_START=35 /DNA_END=1612 /DNA_ORIENTATION=+
MKASDYQQMDDADVAFSPAKKERATTSSSTSSVTLWLVICITHSLIGVFLMGYNTALFNIPGDTIREHASQSYIGQVPWEIINAMFPIGALCGAAFTGKLADRFGRKKMILVNSITNIVASVITATAYYYAQLVLGRFVTGVASGIATAVCSAYLNEVSPDHLRGAIGTLLQITITIAIVISELLGKLWLNDPLWRIGCALGGAMCVVQLLLGFSLLESPKWLMNENRRDEAIDVLRKLRGVNYSSSMSTDAIPMKRTMPHSKDDPDTSKQSVEFSSMDDEMDQHLIGDDDADRKADKNSSLWTGLGQYAVIKRIFLISLFLHMLQQLSGINAVFYYSTDILETAGVNNTWLGSVLLSVANFIAVVAITPFVDRLGRRKLLLVSSAGMVVCCAAITVSFAYLAKYDGQKAEEAWGVITIVCMVLYVMFFEFGLGPLPWVIVAEFTPIEYRGAMVSASQVMNYGCNTVIALTTETLLDALGVYGFVPFGCVCLVGTVLIWLYVPETKQKTTKQIIDEIDPSYYSGR